ncbi:MAG: SdrD B-like domain-containing protein [Chloroflexota bacterium]
MRSIKSILSLLAVAAVLWLAILPVAASPRDEVREAPQAQSNLLTNGSFDADINGWATWSLPPSGGDAPCTRRTPTYQRATEGRRVQAGSGSIQLLGAPQSSGDTGGTFFAGIQQTVNVTAGKKYKFTVWATSWFSTGDNPAVSEGTGSTNIQVGIGQGATYSADPNVTRSGLVNAKDTFQQLNVEVTASGTQLTVFTYANPDSCAKHTEVFFDSASLTEVGAAPTAAPNVTPPTAGPTSPPPRALVGKLPIPTPNAEGKVIFTMPADVTIIDICFSLDRGNDPKCIDDIMKMNGLTNAKFISIGQKLIIATVAAGSQAQPTAAPTATQPQPTAAGGAQPTAAPQATTVGTKVPGAGAICVTLYNDANGNGVLDAGEGLVKGGSFSLLDTSNSAPVASYTTDGVSEPKCFDNLKGGNYRVSSVVPAGYRATTRDVWDLTLASGSTANLEFGAQSSGGTTSTTTNDTGGGNSALTRALLAGAGVVLLLVAAGVAGFLVLTRRR